MQAHAFLPSSHMPSQFPSSNRLPDLHKSPGELFFVLPGVQTHPFLEPPQRDRPHRRQWKGQSQLTTRFQEGCTTKSLKTLLCPFQSRNQQRDKTLKHIPLNWLSFFFQKPRPMLLNVLLHQAGRDTSLVTLHQHTSRRPSAYR